MANNKKNSVAIAALVAVSLWSSQASASTTLPQMLTSTPTSAISWLTTTGLSSLRLVTPLIVAEGMKVGKDLIHTRLANMQMASIMTKTRQSLDATVTGTVKTLSKGRQPSEPRASSSDVFGSVAIPFKRLAALKKAAPTFAEIKNGRALQCKGAGCPSDLSRIQLASLGDTGLSIRDQLNSVNVSVNRAILYQSDAETYGVADRWASPSETLKRQRGDCEDYALLKMAALAARGIALQDMSLVVLYDQKRSFYHAVLSVEVQGRHYILDNLRDQVLLDTQLPDYLPLFSISAGKGYLHGSRIKNKSIAANIKLEAVAPGEGAKL